MKQFYKILLFTIFFVFNTNSIFAADPKAKITISSTIVCQNQAASVTFSVTNGNPQPTILLLIPTH
jgi:hypothetical protein